jgi:hypothetical protein
LVPRVFGLEKLHCTSTNSLCAQWTVRKDSQQLVIPPESGMIRIASV